MASSETGKMRAIAISSYGPSSALKFVDLPVPKPGPKDIIVQNKCAGINPVDILVREGLLGSPVSEDSPIVLGWDAAGIVTAGGEEATGFEVGDEVFYAGDVTRHGSYAEYTAVDYRAVAHKPKALSFEQAAVIPLVALTSWEGIVESMRAKAGQTILLYNGAGGVGSFAIQLAKELGLVVVATASRPETMEWCKKLGADHVVSHLSDVSLKDQLRGVGMDGVNYILHLHEPENIGDLFRLLKPFGPWFMSIHPHPKLGPK
jgi:NADPH:quinone reductase